MDGLNKVGVPIVVAAAKPQVPGAGLGLQKHGIVIRFQRPEDALTRLGALRFGRRRGLVEAGQRDGERERARGGGAERSQFPIQHRDPGYKTMQGA